MPSTFIGQPPNTEEDFYIARGLLRKFYLFDLDPANGAPLPPARPPNAHFETRGPSIVVALSVCIVLVILVTGTRLLIRALHHGVTWGWDDWFMIPAAGSILAWYALGIAMVVYGGGGKHVWSVTYHEYYWFSMLGTIRNVLYLPATCFVKNSITFFNRRLIGLSSKTWRLMNNVFLFILGSYLVAIVVFCTLVHRTDPAARFSLIVAGRAAKPLKNYKPTHLSIGLSVWHIVLDFCLLCTPIILIWKVQMSTAKKVRLIFLFGFGSVSCIGAVMIQVAQYSLSFEDIPWNYRKLDIWIIVDLFFAVTVASLPVLSGQLFKSWDLFRAFISFFGTQDHSHQTPPVRESPSGLEHMQAVIYQHDDLESKSTTTYRNEGDDEIEVLEQGEKSSRKSSSAASIGSQLREKGEF